MAENRLRPASGGGAMRGFRIRALSAALVAGSIGVIAPARAQVNAREPDPAVWLRAIYDLYHRMEKSADPAGQPTYELVEQRASKSLAALFKRNKDCETKSNEICALDWDFVIDGQDWTLSNVNVGPAVVAGDKATVTVRFRNFKTPCVNVYSFVREDGLWKVDNIEVRQGAGAPVRIAKMLKDFNYNQ
jgi:hypothetical protein